MIFCLLIVTFIQSSLQQQYSFSQPIVAIPPSVCVGGSVNISCRVNFTDMGIDSLAAALLTRDESVISRSNPNHVLVSEGQFVVGVLVSNISLDDDNIQYNCSALNAPPDFVSSLRLDVAGPPSVTFASAVDRCIDFYVTWTTDSDTVCGNVSQNVSLLEDRMVVRINSTNETSYNFTGLNKSINYSVNVTATNMAGDSNPVDIRTGVSSSLITIIPQAHDPPEAMASTNVSLNGFQITVSWQAAPTTRCTTDPVNMFIINITIIGVNSTIKMVPSNVFTFDLPNEIIFDNAQYNITVSAMNDVGASDPSYPPVSVNTFILQGCVAESLRVGVITVSCTSSHQIQVTANCTDCGLGAVSNPVFATGPSPLDIINLQPGGMYIITINVYSNGEVVLTNSSERKEIVVLDENNNGGGGDGGGGAGGAIGGAIGGVVAAMIIVGIVIFVIYCYKKKKGETDTDKTTLKMSSPTGTNTGGRVAPSSNLRSGPTEVYADVQKPVPHQTAATGEEYAVSTKAGKPGKGKQQGPTEEYAQIDKSKKSGQQGIQYADLADLPQSTSDPSAKGPTSMYAQVA